MAYGKITKKQMEILECIKQAILDKGYPPTVRELCDMGTSEIHLFHPRESGGNGTERLYPPGSLQAPGD